MRPLINIRGIPGVSLLGNAGIYTFGNFLPQAVNVLLLPVFTRFLSQSEYGILAYTTSLNVFLFVVGSFSIHSYVLRRWFDYETDEERRRLLGTIFIYLVVYNLILLAGAMWLMPPIFESLSVQVDFDPYVKLALLINFINIVGILPQVYFRVNQQPGRFVALMLAQLIMASGLSLYLVAFRDMGVIGRYYGLLGAGAIMLVVYLVIIIRISSFVLEPRQLKRALTFSAPLLVAALLHNVINVSDRFILERYVALSQIGLYSVGVLIGSGLSFLSNGIYKAVEPDIFRLANTPDFDKKVRSLKWFVDLVVLGIGFVMIVLAREIVEVVTDSSFAVSYTIVQLIALAMIVQGAWLTVSSYLVARYQVRDMAYVTLVGALTSVALNLLLVPRWGIHGAATAAVASNVIMLYAYIFVTERKFAVRWGIGRSSVLITAVCLIGFGVSQIQTPTLILTGVVKIAVIALPLIIYFRWVFVNANKNGALNISDLSSTDRSGMTA